MLYYIPIEPLEERYTEQWYRWFPAEFEKRSIEYTIIDGISLIEYVKTGTFLDVNSTLHYKSIQLQKISKLFFDGKIQNGDIFFVADIEFWGIESIKYLAVLQNIDIKLYGFCHAGSYTKGDYFAKAESFAKYYECAWGHIFDKIFVGSEYHKKQLIKLRNISENKIIVSGNPYNIEEVQNQISHKPKKNIILLSNRPDPEKNPNLSLDVFIALKDKLPDWEFKICTSRQQWGRGWIYDKARWMAKNGVLEIHEGLFKIDYLSLLQQSKIMVSNSLEENFGYCILESLIFDTIPILPNCCSHIEILNNNSNLLFDDIDDQISKIIAQTKQPPGTLHLSQYLDKYKESFDIIINNFYYHI